MATGRQVHLLSRVTFSGSPPPIQPKLTIGEPNDKYEQEADRYSIFQDYEV